jgi:hypothetical protein
VRDFPENIQSPLFLLKRPAKKPLYPNVAASVSEWTSIRPGTSRSVKLILSDRSSQIGIFGKFRYAQADGGWAWLATRLRSRPHTGKLFCFPL